MLGFLMNRFVLGGIVGLLMLGFAFWKGYSQGELSVQKRWDADKIVQERALQAAAAKTAEVERDLQAKADKNLKERLSEFQTVSVRYHALLNSLRNRPEARAETGVPENAGDVVGCTGEGLARPDAEFLAGYAADAARLQAAYDSCRQAYEEVKNARESQ